MSYEIEKDGVKLEIWRDIDPINPREWDNLGTIFASSRYTIGEVEEISHVLIDLDLSCSRYERLLDTGNLDEITIEIEKDGGVTLPLYMYDHGGIAIATSPFSCNWDSGHLGFIYVLGPTLRKEFGWKRVGAARVRKIKTILQSEIDELNQYLQGDVWGFTLYENGELSETCGNFYDIQDISHHLQEQERDLLRTLIERENL